MSASRSEAMAYSLGPLSPWERGGVRGPGHKPRVNQQPDASPHRAGLHIGDPRIYHPLPLTPCPLPLTPYP